MPSVLLPKQCRCKCDACDRCIDHAEWKRLVRLAAEGSTLAHDILLGNGWLEASIKKIGFVRRSIEQPTHFKLVKGPRYGAANDTPYRKHRREIVAAWRARRRAVGIGDDSGIGHKGRESRIKPGMLPIEQSMSMSGCSLLGA